MVPQEVAVLRVLHVLTTDQRRGAELSAVTLQAELRRRGHDARAVALAPATGSARLDDVAVLGGSRLGWRTLRALRSTARTADVVLAHGSSTLPACALALHGRSSPPFLYANIGDPLYWASSTVKRARVQALLSRASAVAARSEEAARALTDDLGVPAQRVRVIPNGRDVARFPFAHASRRLEARRRLALTQDESAVVVLGALAPEKRVDVAVRAMAEVAGTLLVAGEGPERPALEDLARRLLPGRARFLGQVSDVPGLLAACDVLVLTSDSEGLPGVLIEAGLTGLPVVATDVGFVRDIVRDGVTGFVVPADDPAAAAAALRQALRERDEMGRRARAHCLERFDMANVALRWEQLIQDVARSRDPSSAAAGRPRPR